MTLAEVHAAVETEGLTLLRADNQTGFKGVSYEDRKRKFHAWAHRQGHSVSLGHFVTAEEAALAVARFIGPEGIAAALAPLAPEPVPMTAEEAHAAAVAEGLSLVRADNPTGFKNVSRDSRRSRPFKVGVSVAGHDTQLGSYATAEEAALASRASSGPRAWRRHSRRPRRSPQE